MKLAQTQAVCLNGGFSSNALPLQQSVKPSVIAPAKVTYEHKASSSPAKSDDESVSMDETMSSCDSYNKSPRVEYIDNEEVSAVVSIERKALSNLYITPNPETTGYFSLLFFHQRFGSYIVFLTICWISWIAGNCCRRDVMSEIKTDKDKFVNIDSNDKDPQLCATYACDIYKHLRAAEV